MEEYEVYRPNEPKGFYLDPRTKILFMIFITTIMSVGYKDIVISLISAIVAIMLLLSNKQFRIAFIYGGVVCFGFDSTLYKRYVHLPYSYKYHFRFVECFNFEAISDFYVGLLYCNVYKDK